MPDTVIIADDVTGANDIGIMYTKAGLVSVVYSLDKLKPDMIFNNDVTIIDTNSRFCSYEEAYQRVYEATNKFDKSTVHQFFNKQCSVFRGNIGAEFDAMLDALEEEFAIVVLGFPDNGRTTHHSIHYVHGIRLEESQFNQDPMHPMKQSNLVDILQSQTKRKVAAIFYEIIDQGVEALKNEISRMKTETNYVIIDVRNNQDLSIIAQAVIEEKILCGSSALGYPLGLLKKSTGTDVSLKRSEDSNQKILCIAGSLTPQTKSQVAYMKEMNYPVIMLNTTKLFVDEDRNIEKSRILDAYKEAQENNNFILIHSMNREEDVNRTKMIAAEYHINNTNVSELVSNTLAELAKEIGNRFKIMKYIICGGDTSASFCNSLNIIGMKVLREIEAGLPTCQSITEPYYQLVLKSGSFGSEQFIEIAKNILVGANLEIDQK